MDTSKVTRFEVINNRTENDESDRGRVMVEHNLSLELSLQDDGRTLKVFLNDKKE